jgi:hypothetical protein
MAKIPQFASAPTQFLGFAAFFGAFFGNAFGPVSTGLVALYVACSLIAGVIIGYISVSLPQAFVKAETDTKKIDQ